MPRALEIASGVLTAALLTAVVTAHPGNGIEVAADGTVYFADVGHRTIWRVATDGSMTPLVQSSWTHSLQLQEDGTLYYEREIPVDGPAPCSFWKITPEGKRVRLIEPQADRASFGGADFVVDAAGNVHFAHSVRDAENNWRARILKRTPEGAVTVFTGGGDGPLFTDGPPDTATIRIVTAMARGPGGDIYFADRDHVRRITPDGTVSTIATKLIDEEPEDPPHRSGPPTTINRLYGLTVTDDRVIYVAYQAGRRVIRIDADGNRSVAFRSMGRWSPIGVAERDGNLYVLESGHERGNDTPGPRVRKVTAEGMVSTVAVVR